MLVWHDQAIIVPRTSTAPLAHADMPEEIKADFEEARSVVMDSPRSASALLRLTVQKLCKFLGEKGDNLNSDISSLVKKGLPAQVQQALDIVRVIGNNQVHPGVIDLRDDPETAQNLFGLVNLIVEVMIAQPKHVASLYSKLPLQAKEAIVKRDS
jgi:hypothetical protein